MCVAVAGSTSVTVIVVHNIGETQPLVGTVYRGFLPLPRGQQGLCFLDRLWVGFLYLGLVIADLHHHTYILASVFPKEECSREEFLL